MIAPAITTEVLIPPLTALLTEQTAGPTRAEEVIEIEAQLLDLYRDPNLKTKPALLENRGGAYYSEAAAQLVASLHDGRGDVQVVDYNEHAHAKGIYRLYDFPGVRHVKTVRMVARAESDDATLRLYLRR